MKYKFTMRVIYKDVDKMGVVHHSNYYNFFELARTELFRSEGISYKSIEERGLMFPVAESHCNYRKPVGYDDIIDIFVWVGYARACSIRFNYEIINSIQEVCTRGHTIHPLIDNNWNIIECPDDLRLIAEKYIEK